jgi:3-hydroxybutyryl-CoA dehydrogenase
MSINTIMIIGAGQMGGGIAQVAAQAGLQVILNDIKDEFVQKGLGNIRRRLARNVEKELMTEQEMQAALGCITSSVSLDDAAQADFIVEAASENMEIKTRIFQALDQALDRADRPEVILATNTSSLPITEIAAMTNRPGQVIGMHFMNPVPVMELVEVIRGIATTDETYQVVEGLATVMGKTAVEGNDSPGFIANRILLPMINEAIFCVYEGVGKPEAIDNVAMLGMNHPMGPLALADFIGLDTCLAIMEVLHEGFADSKYRPCPLLRKMVKAGWLGKKSGKGFYEYN